MSVSSDPHGGNSSTNSPAQRIDVLGVHVSAVSMTQAIDLLNTTVESGEAGYVCVSDVNAVLHASRNPDLKRIFNNSLLTVPDGIPLVWAGRHAGAKWMSRVSGPDLMPALLRSAAQKGWSSYFMGGTADIVSRLVASFEDEIPDFKVAGWCSPPFRELTDEEQADIIADINGSGASILWVGLGAPKQEYWMGKHFSAISIPLTLGVGGAFDMNSGAIRRAPRWMQRSGLEWSFRLSQEPRRLWHRYSRNIPAFAWQILRCPPRLVTK